MIIPAPEKWCLLEIVFHLYDEEREEFRARVNYQTNYLTAEVMPLIFQKFLFY